MESVAAFMTLIVRRRLVSAQESADMHDLLTRAATSGSGTWTKYALDGFDDQSDASLTRTHLSVGGKIGFPHRGTKAQWWDTVYTMSDASIVQKTASKTYVLVFCIAPAPGIIRQKDIFPLIRSLHDCI